MWTVTAECNATGMDFEIAAHNATLRVFHNRSITGRFYHLTQSTWNKVLLVDTMWIHPSRTFPGNSIPWHSCL